MSQYNTVSPAEVGIMSGLMGAGIGYTNADQHAAHKVLLEGREILNKAHQNNTMEAKLADLLGSPKYSKAYRNIKNLLPKARIQTAIVLGTIGGLVGIIGKIIMGDNN